MVNLLIVPPRLPGMRRVFKDLARYVEEQPGVRPFVVRDRRQIGRRWRWVTRRTFVFAPMHLRRFRPVRGRTIQGRTIPKSVQAKILGEAGLPVPRWKLLSGPGPVDLDGFGPYVVVKPDLGLRSIDVKFKKRSRVQWKPTNSPLNGKPTSLLVQESVYTGRWPVSFRVLTLLGEVLYCVRAEANHGRDPLQGRFAFGEGGRPPVSACGRDCRWSLQQDEEVMALARRVHACFADVPLLGIDIIRDSETGRLYVLETNPDGGTWAMRADMGRSMKVDLESQFDGMRVAARVLAAKARAEAR